VRYLKAPPFVQIRVCALALASIQLNVTLPSSCGHDDVCQCHTGVLPWAYAQHSLLASC